MDKPVALIVEDEPLLMMQATDIVENAGFEVIEAQNAEQAVGILESRNDIRVVVTDIQMPGSMDGMKLAWAIRDRWPPVAIIVVSGHVKPAHDDLPENVTFIAKPYSEQQMHDALAMVA